MFSCMYSVSFGYYACVFFFFKAEDGIRDDLVTGVQTCALPISLRRAPREAPRFAAPDGPERRRRGRDDEVDLPRLQRDARVAHPLVGNVREIDARVRVEELAHDVDDAAHAGRAEVELPRPPARFAADPAEALALPP